MVIWQTGLQRRKEKIAFQCDILPCWTSFLAGGLAGVLVQFLITQHFATLRSWEPPQTSRSAIYMPMSQKKEFFAVLNYLQPRLLTPLTHSIYSRFNHTRIRRQIRLIGCDKDARSFTKVKDGWHHSKRSSIPWIIVLFFSPLTT